MRRIATSAASSRGPDAEPRERRADPFDHQLGRLATVEAAPQAIGAEALAALAAGLDHPVGVEDELIAGLDLDRDRLPVGLVDDPQQRSRVADRQRPPAAQLHRMGVAGEVDECLRRRRGGVG